MVEQPDNIQSPSTSSAFTSMLNNYNLAMSSIMNAMISMSASSSSMNPGDFLMLQFLLGQVTQVGDSISNLIQQVNSTIANSIRNFKG